MPPRKSRPSKAGAVATAASTAGVKKRGRRAKSAGVAQKPPSKKPTKQPKEAAKPIQASTPSTTQPKSSTSKQANGCPTCGCTCKTAKDSITAGWSDVELGKWRKGVEGSYAFRSQESEEQWDCLDEMYFRLFVDSRSNSVIGEYHSGCLEGTLEISSTLVPNEKLRFEWTGSEPLEFSDDVHGYGEITINENFEIKGFFADMGGDDLMFEGAKDVENEDYRPSFQYRDDDDDSEEAEAIDSDESRGSDDDDEY
ncbi:hypothetical protein TWF694_006091 [Orbilia ellipsospora]|uniref:Uncharacterized protein n=1 Tax=Orbilia ellipsospora TaxID=2528407 RepID=A0AAV9WTA5_9PEZI